MKLNNNIDYDYAESCERYWKQYLLDLVEALYECDSLESDLKDWLDSVSENDVMLFIEKSLTRFYRTDYVWEAIDNTFRDCMYDTYMELSNDL